MLRILFELKGNILNQRTHNTYFPRYRLQLIAINYNANSLSSPRTTQNNKMTKLINARCSSSSLSIRRLKKKKNKTTTIDTTREKSSATGGNFVVMRLNIAVSFFFRSCFLFSADKTTHYGFALRDVTERSSSRGWSAPAATELLV